MGEECLHPSRLYKGNKNKIIIQTSSALTLFSQSKCLVFKLLKLVTEY